MEICLVTEEHKGIMKQVFAFFREKNFMDSVLASLPIWMDEISGIHGEFVLLCDQKL